MHVQTFGGAVKKREPGEILPEKKCSLEINSRELGTLRCAKCVIDSCVFVFVFFTSLFQIFSSSTALCPSTEIFKIQIPVCGKYFCISIITVPATRKFT